MPTCDPMILMQNRGAVPKETALRITAPSTSGSSHRAFRGHHSERYPYAAGIPFPPIAQHIRPPLNWASVASWFFRPDCPQMSTTLSSNTQASCTTSTSTSCSTKAQSSHSGYISHRQQTQQQHQQQQQPQQQQQQQLLQQQQQSTTAATGSTASALCSQRDDQPQRIIQAPTICTAIRCTVPSCGCECFTPGKRHLRYCETCKHGWVPHALDKLGSRHLFTNSAPEPVQPNAAFDIASLVLYGCQALPIRLKILLDRLFSVLQKDQVIQVLHGFGWTQEDYARGYILQEAHGAALDRWSICSPEEEPLVLQQFLRFGETRAITQQLLLAQQALQESPMLDHLERKSLSQPPRRTVSPNHRPSPPSFTPSVFNPSRLPSMSPHQKHSLNFLKLPPSNGPTASTSPPTSMSTSPLSVSPLNRLQNMQPFDFRKLGAGIAGFPSTRVSPDLQMRRRTAEADSISAGLNLSMSTPIPMCLPPPPPPPPVSAAAISIANSLNHSAAAMAAAVTANPLVTASLVASSFPSLISSGSKSPSTADFLSGGGSSDFGSEEDDDDEENSHSALNLSRDKDAHKIARQHQARSSGHIRKASTPTKRHWGSSSLPLNLGTQFINPATGKKRVQCNVCLKTFCDKGALKIHFSAVHLREMHKCTVEGCNMMFSSRRSRNRHSANPNPKLHSPHLRRKISPHDGRSSQAHPLLIPPQSGLSLPAAAAALSPLNPFGPFPLLTPPRDMRHHSALAAMDFKQSLDLSMQRYEDARKDFNTTSSEDGALALTTSSHQDDEEDDDDDGIVVVGGDDDDDTERNESAEGNEISDQPEDFSMPSKRPKMSVSDVEEDLASNVDSNEDSLSVVDTHSLKDESSFTTNKRKRKSQNPVRCAVPSMMEDAMTDCDSSNDIVFRDSLHEQREPEELVKRIIKDERNSPSYEDKKNDDIKVKNENEIPRCSSANDMGKNSPDVNANEPEINNEIKTSLAPLFSMDKIKKEKTSHDTTEQDHTQLQEENVIDKEEDRPPSSTGSHKSDESIDSSNALRHLESLSHGHFSDLMSRNLHLGLGTQPSQFPTLGFMMGGDPPSPARSHTSSAGSSNGAESQDENSQNQIFGHFDNGQFISTMDVPIDKDNPRRCTACGKIFQNHFGVKTHYQNVHLKLMHKCNVDGCNAAFPSKRSRDRHSANLNLHRKLLSTSSSSDKPGASLFMDKSPFASLASNAALHNEFLARLYADTHGLPLNLDAALKGHPLPPSAALEQMMLNGGDRLPPPPLLLPPLAFPLGTLTNHHHHQNHGFPLTNGSPSTCSKKDRSSDGSGSGSGSGSPISPGAGSSSSPAPTTVSGSLSLIYSVEDEMPTPDSDGNLPCRICRTPLRDVASLREHCEQKHIADMYRCTVPGCPRLFTSRTKRNLHADNVSAHLQLTNSTPDQRRPSNGNCS